MRQRLLAVDVTLHDSVLVDTHRGEKIEGVLVAGVDTVEHKTDDDLLPGGTALVPELGLLEVDDVPDILHDTVERAGGEGLVFIVVGDGNE